ncbi:hypothetical protein KFE25_000520 [Diacronema lutheri]|uniref:FAM192A/Fyv6 N-terminal domain-containing protein n=2 Tax=Diacronema lutheri TaxID=2081491 RepID=A0A8J5XNW3_DIALT|nr:hypothetical protein KFE25_000520 [Diacronema lutheri]
MAAHGGREVHEVFSKSAPVPKSMLDERFGSSGKYSVVELEATVPAGLRAAKPQQQLAPGLKVRVIGRYGVGELVERVEEGSLSWRVLFEDGIEAIVLADRITTELKAPEEAAAADTRTLYERLKEQRDAKQEEWEHKHTFKNQMDHWRLDEDDAAFENERVERLRAEAEQQRAEADEDLLRYRAAMLGKTRKVEPEQAAAALLAPALPAALTDQVEHTAAKRKAPFPTPPVGLKVKPLAKKGKADAPAGGKSAARSPPAVILPPTSTSQQPQAPNTARAEPRAAACALAGMAAYADDDSDSNGASGEGS